MIAMDFLLEPGGWKPHISNNGRMLYSRGTSHDSAAEAVRYVDLLYNKFRTDHWPVWRPCVEDHGNKGLRHRAHIQNTMSA